MSPVVVAAAGSFTSLRPCGALREPFLAGRAVAQPPRRPNCSTRSHKAQAASCVLSGSGPLGDPHRVLGVEPGADSATIKKAFRRLALRYHPDVSHAPEAQERFQAIQHAYDMLMARHQQESAAGDSASWPRRRRPPPDEAPTAAVPEVPRTPEQQQERWRQQLGGLGQRAAAQRERRESEKKYRAAMREHAVRGSFSGVASTDAGRERLQTQLSDLYYAASTASGGALASHAQPPEAHMLSAHASGLARAAQAADDASAAPPPPPPPLSATEKEVMQQLVRLARVAQTWRVVSGLEPAASGSSKEPSEEALTPGE